MAGIYIHIPFCKSKCIYCNFYSVTTASAMDDFVPAAMKEIQLQKKYLYGEKVETIYVGGGTPSLMKNTAIQKIIEQIFNVFSVESHAEITLEANPDDITNIKLKEWLAAGINRISIGVQSFHEDDLKYLKRIHSASQSESSVKRSQDAGFENISIDLIYGVPVQTDRSWKENIKTSLLMQVPHISAYALTTEDKTVLQKKIRDRKISVPDEEQAAMHFRILMKEMKNANFLHYEISNFCMNGFFSKHNTAYWKNKNYLGVGPSAHSYNGTSRQWNISSLNEYLKLIAENKVPFEKEILTSFQKLNEYIMTSIRTMWGCDLTWIEREYGTDERIRITSLAQDLSDKNYLEISDDTILLTDEGKLFCDGITSALFH